MPVPAREKKSDRTRMAILVAAREQFAQHPYDRASIRAIASQARIDPAMVLRYFTNKETLFATVVDIDLHLPDLRAVEADDRGEVLLRHFLGMWEGEARHNALPILLRSAVTHEAAAERLREVFRDQVRGVVAAVVPKSEAARRASLISSQLLGLVLTRYVLRLPDMTDRDAEGLIADMAPTVQRYLNGSLTTPKRGR
ncbi:TetR family transcriptional regulator [Kribbella sancticallisti]|uniref:TetR family transcriptional regulator n=1 Tax=Kribbella sancticallisti TaxID=460087 RepID=A0ABP4PP01_9ACTN